jgi:formylglycine-generating enzyme required for sulfatase activity
MDKPRIFVSYRREDSRHQTDRICDHLVPQFGRDCVFQDVDNQIPLGRDFRDVLSERVARCDVFLAIIGDAWLSMTGPDGTRRLDEPGDYVRIEIEAALARNIPVIPVLVGRSSVPHANELPGSLQTLAYRQAILVRPNPDFHHDMERLVHGIKDVKSAPPVPTLKRIASPPPRPGRRRPPWKAIVAAAVLGLVLLGVIVYVATDKGRTAIVVNDPNSVEPAGNRTATASPEKPPEVSPSRPPPLVERRPELVPAPAPAPTEITNSIGIKLVLIPAGEFLMGSPDSDPDADADEKPQHRVRITRPFYLGVRELTQGQYRAVAGENPGHFKESDDLPVESVSWLDAITYCNALSRKEGLAPFYRVQGATVEVPDWDGTGYRLPTEAEREYACRAGSTTRFSFGDDAVGLGAFAWYGGNSRQRTHPVGEKQPNAWALYDMHGNVWEWCWDGYEADQYKKWSAADPLGPAHAASHVFRGGGWDDDPRFERSANRSWSAPGDRSSYVGFRVARVQSGR